MKYSELKMAVIMDDFTYHSYLPECELLQLTPEDWSDQLEFFQPDILFIESAWRGKDELWKNKIGHISRELLGIIDWCKKKKIPTCFWNKEDPVHFSTFLNVATLFDVIFTTDIDCVSLYKAKLDHESVFFLPFACQPQINNPIELNTPRKKGVCFAGAYYSKYPERNKNLDSIIESLQDDKQIDIYDRNFGKDMPGYSFPDHYSHLIKGSLPFEKIDIAYKGYEYAINLNSVKNSQTMFARRAYELFASNSLVLSNFSRGLRLMFGDLVACSDSGEFIANWVKHLDANANYKDKLKLLALRKTLNEHTYAHRLQYIVQIVTRSQSIEDIQEIAAFAYCDSASKAEKVIGSFNKQKHSNKILHLFLSSNIKLKYFPSDNIILYPKSSWFFSAYRKKKINQFISNPCWLAKFSDKDYYGENYLTDLINGTLYSEAKIIGKASYYVQDLDENKQKVIEPENEYKYVYSLELDRSIVCSSIVEEKSVRDFIKLLSIASENETSCLSVDRFNYCKNGSSLSPEELKVTSDIEDIDLGISLGQLNRTTCPACPIFSKSAELSEILPMQLFKSCFNANEGAVRCSYKSNKLFLESTLTEGKSISLESSDSHDISIFNLKKFNSNRISILVKGKSDSDCSLVIKYFDQTKVNLTHDLVILNNKKTITIPEKTRFISFAIRIRHKGNTMIDTIILESIDTAPATGSNLDSIHFGSLFSTRSQGDLSINTKDNYLILNSSLGVNKHQYIYSRQLHDNTLFCRGEKLKLIQKLYIEACETKMQSNFVIHYIDANNEELGHEILPVNQNLEIRIPKQTKFFKLGFRGAGSGQSVFKFIYNSVKRSYNSSNQAILSIDFLKLSFAKSKSPNVNLSFNNENFIVNSTLEDGIHAYLNSPLAHDISLLSLNSQNNSNSVDFYFQTTSGLYMYLVIYYLDKDRKRVSHKMVSTNKNTQLTIPKKAKLFSLGFRLLGTGMSIIEELVFAKKSILPSKIISESDTLILTNHYPSYDNLYRNGFVHSRVKAYKTESLNVDIYRFWKGANVTYHEFENIDVTTGGAEGFNHLLKHGNYKKVLVHFLDRDMWEILKNFQNDLEIIVWLHGSEIQPWWRRAYNYTNDEKLAIAKTESQERMMFWRDLFENLSDSLKFVFVSRYFADEVMEDVGIPLKNTQYEIIHNPIDTTIFTYEKKPIEQRLKVLSIRPYASEKYANDLSVKAVLLLSTEPWFDEIEFKFIGDGKLFDEVLEPIEHFENVTLERGFLKQTQIADLHKEYGVFLCPTRMDAQGVSKDEAMSSGLVVISNAVTAIPEFIDNDSGILAPDEDAVEMAEGIKRLYNDGRYFSRLSKNAAQRVHLQTSHNLILKKELNLIIASSYKK